MWVLTMVACQGFADAMADANSASADWTVSDVVIAPDSLNYAVVSGTVTLEDDLAAGGTSATVRFYEDEYQTVIVESESWVGEDLDEAGTTQLFELSDYRVFVQPAYDGFAMVCAELFVDDSNVADGVQVGCTP